MLNDSILFSNSYIDPGVVHAGYRAPVATVYSSGYNADILYQLNTFNN